MNTSAVNNPLGLLPTPAANNKQDATPSSGAGAFNQMLSREIDRSKNASNDAAKNTQTSGNGDKNAAADANSAAKNDNSNADTVKNTGEAQAADGRENDVEAVAPSAELLAFVAALTQANTAVADDALPAGVKTVDVDAKADADAALKLAADTVDTAAAGDKDAIGKKSDFVAALDKATTAAAEDGKAAAAPATTATKGDAAALAAATQTAKTIEPVLTTNSTAATQAIANLTPAMLQQLNDAQAVQSNKLAPQVGNPGWDQALGQKVVWMIQGAQQTATLTLNPPELGPMQVTLNVANNQATANFTAQQPEVRHALEAAMPRLREMLNDAGIQLGQSSVSAGTPDQQNASSEQGQRGRTGNHDSDAAEAAIHVSHVPISSTGTGLVDTFA